MGWPSPRPVQLEHGPSRHLADIKHAVLSEAGMAVYSGQSDSTTGIDCSSGTSSSSSGSSSGTAMLAAHHGSTRNDANPPTITVNTGRHHIWPSLAASPPTVCTTDLPGKCIHSKLTIAKCVFCKPCHNNAMSKFGLTMRCPTHADHRSDRIPRGTKRPSDLIQHTPHRTEHPSPAHTTAIK